MSMMNTCTIHVRNGSQEHYDAGMYNMIEMYPDVSGYELPNLYLHHWSAGATLGRILCFCLRPITLGTTVSANTYLRLYHFATYKDLKHVPCRIEQTTQFYIAIAILLAFCPPSCTCLRKRGTPNYKQKCTP